MKVDVSVYYKLTRWGTVLFEN